MAADERIKHPQAIPNHQSAIVPPNKLLRYALDPTNPRGKHKARVFKSALGFDQTNWEALKERVLDELPYHQATATIEDLYGRRYKVVLPIKGPNGNTRDVVVTWIIKAGLDYPSLDSIWVQ